MVLLPVDCLSFMCLIENMDGLKSDFSHVSYERSHSSSGPLMFSIDQRLYLMLLVDLFITLFYMWTFLHTFTGCFVTFSPNDPFWKWRSIILNDSRHNWPCRRSYPLSCRSYPSGLCIQTTPDIHRGDRWKKDQLIQCIDWGNVNPSGWVHGNSIWTFRLLSSPVKWRRRLPLRSEGILSPQVTIFLGLLVQEVYKSGRTGGVWFTVRRSETGTSEVDDQEIHLIDYCF